MLDAKYRGCLDPPLEFLVKARDRHLVSIITQCFLMLLKFLGNSHESPEARVSQLPRVIHDSHTDVPTPGQLGPGHRMVSGYRAASGDSQ